MRTEFERALRKLRAGNLPGAGKICRDILAKDPGQHGAMHLLGIVERGQGRLEDAHRWISLAHENDPHNANYQLSLGTLYCQMGRLEDGVSMLRAAYELEPENAEILNNLGVALMEAGALGEAATVLENGIAVSPETAETHGNLAIVLGMQKRFDEAVAACRRALKIRPDYPKASATLRNIFQQRIPLWHWPMMNDLPRNRAYDETLREMIQPGMVVIDIGSGSGLLALMAARAGAGHVYSCEMDPLVAEKAAEIVAQNGYSDRVTIIPTNSARLSIGRDVPERADLLVTETFDARLLGEDVIQIINDARTRLLKADAPVIPGRARVYCQFLESPVLVDSARVGEVCGFDLSAFNEFSSSAYEIQLQVREGWRGLTDVVHVMDIDFSAEAITPQQVNVRVQVSNPGTFQALAYWFQLDFGGGRIIDSGPYAEDSHWKQMVQIEPAQRLFEAGQTLSLDVLHNNRELIFQVRD